VTTTGFNQQYERCKQALERFEMCVQQRNWSAVDQLASAYAAALQSLLGDPVLSVSSVKPELLLDLQALSLKHRRIIRQLSQHMRQTEEDIAWLDQTSRKLEHTRSALR